MAERARGAHTSRVSGDRDAEVHNALSQEGRDAQTGDKGSRHTRLPNAPDFPHGEAQEEERTHPAGDMSLPERGRGSRRDGANSEDAGSHPAAQPPLKMRFVEEMDLDKVELIAEAHSSKGDIQKLRHNLRFVRDLGVYEELLGPTIREPEPIPLPEKMSRSDFENGEV